MDKKVYEILLALACHLRGDGFTLSVVGVDDGDVSVEDSHRSLFVSVRTLDFRISVFLYSLF